MITLVLHGVVALPAVALPEHPHPIALSESGSNGTVAGTSVDCPSGTLDQTRYWAAGASLPAGAFSALASQLGLDLQVETSATAAALRGTDSRVTLQNARGTLALALSSGSCTQPSLAFNGTASGSGTWAVVPDASPTNAYRNSSGSGSFTLTAGLNAGGNPWALALNGSVTIKQPNATVSARPFWGNLGFDYLSRVVSVEYRVANSGPGDAFGVKLLGAPTTTGGVTNIGPTPQALADVPAGRSTSAVVRYRLGLTARRVGGWCWAADSTPRPRSPTPTHSTRAAPRPSRSPSTHRWYRSAKARRPRDERCLSPDAVNRSLWPRERMSVVRTRSLACAAVAGRARQQRVTSGGRL